MMRHAGTRRAAWLLPLLVLFGPGCARPQAATPEEISRAAVRKDTVALAHYAAAECGRLADSVRKSCYEAFFVQLAGSDRVRVALGALSVLAADHPDVALDGHGYTHMIGIRAWHPGLDVATIFRSCTGLFQSGCYHGVIQAYLTQSGKPDSAHAVELCDEIAPGDSNRWLRFQCAHGLGHGLDMSMEWNLPGALKGCDWLHSAWDRTSCYGGAFMENEVASTPGGHHMAMDALTASHHIEAARGMTGMSMPDPRQITFKMRDSADALYPCSAVDSIYQFACYQLQGGIILERTGANFARATAECDKVRVPLFRAQCYLSLGTDASGMTLRDAKASIADCSHGDPEYQPYCIEGAAKNFVDVTARPQDGLDFCAQVPTGPNRTECYVAIGEEISVLYVNDPEARAAACQPAGAEGEADCRRGAGLPAG
jgi:hypothetical protein